MFRATVTFHPHSSLLKLKPGFMKTSSFTSFTCPWRKHVFVENDRCHMMSSTLQNRPTSFFQFNTKSNSGKVLAISRNFQESRRSYCKNHSANCFLIPKYFEKYSIRQYSTGTKNMGGKGPGLIVFDLDCTLWACHVDTTVNPPFTQQKDSTVVDQDGTVIKYYPEVPQVLEYLKNEGYTIGVASRTTKPPAAEQLLNFFDWNKYISYKEIYPGSKVTHFARFVEQTKLPHEQMLFFDDEQRNIIDMKQQGVKCVYVENGVDLKLVKESIEQFKSGQL